MSAPLTRRRFTLRLAAAALAAPTLAARAQSDALPYAERSDVQQWVARTAASHALPQEWVRAALAQARFQPRVQHLMLPAPAGSRNWRAYRSRFVEPVRIRAGARFWRRNASVLARAEQHYGVPPEIICGILGVETLYGRNMGTFRVLDALATLTFDFPAEHPRAAARQSYFSGELAAFLQLCRSNGFTPTQPLGSYAGAMGIAQFMPSSWLRFAVDFDGDGRIDLWRSAADAIGSVASYFAGHGWKPGVPARWRVYLMESANQPQLLANDIRPSMSAAQMRALGALLLEGGSSYGGQLALIELPNGEDSPPDYFAGSENFYAITRYNQSSLYAMAVLELGEAIAQAVRDEQG